MAQELITYAAQKVKIKALRGNRFSLVVNIKNSNGSDYDFDDSVTFGDGSSTTVFDSGYFQVFTSDGGALFNSFAGQQQGSIDTIDFQVTVANGKLTIETIDSDGFWPTPGTYKYILYTKEESALGTADNVLKYWLHGDFVVVDDNPATNLGGVPVQGVGLQDSSSG
tara:strand:- start:59 stop:559 length:501 start_codon:yes stop_codon:yes gene_type:complete